MPQQNLNSVRGSSQKASAKMIHFSLWLLNFLLPLTWREQNWCDAICILCNPLFLLASKQHNNFYELIRYFYLLNKHTCLKKATFWIVVAFVSHFFLLCWDHETYISEWNWKLIKTANCNKFWAFEEYIWSRFEAVWVSNPV